LYCCDRTPERFVTAQRRAWVSVQPAPPRRQPDEIDVEPPRGGGLWNRLWCGARGGAISSCAGGCKSAGPVVRGDSFGGSAIVAATPSGRRHARTRSSCRFHRC
jgi:hypothetical protein